VSLTSPVFLMVFVPLAMAGVAAFRRAGAPRVAGGWLVAASLLFCWLLDPRAILPLVVSASFNYAIGGVIARAETARPARRRALLAFGVIANLGLLAYYKYGPLLPSAFGARAEALGGLALGEMPVGLSLLTFVQIAFLVDVAAGRTRPGGLVDYGVFVSFFPKLIAGPIVRHGEFAPQLPAAVSRGPRSTDIAEGVTLVAIGLFKKLALADGLAPHVNLVFGAAATGATLSLVEAWGGVLAYTFQLYFDFSGYSDLAIGFARLFGITLPNNFNSPYKATSISDYWKRWHMTLSAFLRDYIYLPLGGKRKGIARQYLHLVITMAVCGLWHGARWGFLVWGLLHGVFLIANHAWRRRGFSCPASVGWALTFLAACTSRVWFRADDLATAWRILVSCAGMNGALPAGASLATVVAGMTAPTGTNASLAALLVSLGGSVSLWGMRLYPAAILLSALSVKVLYLAVSAVVAFGLPNSQEFVAVVGQYRGRTKAIAMAAWTGFLFYLAMLASIASQPTAFVYRRF
jgi:alginate O-acetyltransferase complex protein AlgI